jgi:hypothetical protein
VCFTSLLAGWLLLLLLAAGVTVDRDVRQGAAIMAGSVLLYGTVQLPASMGFSNSPQVGGGRGVLLPDMTCYSGGCNHRNHLLSNTPTIVAMLRTHIAGRMAAQQGCMG